MISVAPAARFFQKTILFADVTAAVFVHLISYRSCVSNEFGANTIKQS